jgi:hypothetical protein
MSITVKQTIVQQVSAPSLGIVISESEISVNITYTAKSVMFLSGNMATVEFETSVEGGLQTGVGLLTAPIPATEIHWMKLRPD